MRPVSTCHGELSVLVEVYRVTATVSGSLGTGSQPQSGGGGAAVVSTPPACRVTESANLGAPQNP